MGIATFSLASLTLEMETFDPLGLLLLVFYALVIGILMFGPGVWQYFTTPVQTGKSRHMND